MPDATEPNEGTPMASKYESAQLLLKLYDLRRDETMRKARDWFLAFDPAGLNDVIKAANGPTSAYYRMVTTYWDMAASFVNHDVIDEAMFNETINEHAAVFCKVQPYLAELRVAFAEPGYLMHLEKLVMRMPKAAERLDQLRRRVKVLAKANESRS
jgi:hypothetical protein